MCFVARFRQNFYNELFIGFYGMLAKEQISPYQYDLILQKGFFCLLFCLGGFALFLFGGLVSIEPKNEYRESDGGWASSTKFFPKALLERDPFWIPLEDLFKQLFFYKVPIRPDWSSKGELILLGIEGCEEKSLLKEGKRVYLDCKKEGEIFFSKEGITPFWVELLLEEKGEARVFFNTEYRDKEGEASLKRYFLKERRGVYSGQHLQSLVAYLGKMKLYEPDCLFDLYGGEAFSQVKGCYRLWQEEKEEMFFIQLGDTLVWKEGRLSSCLEKSDQYPLLQVEEIEPHKCKIAFWSIDGLEKASIDLFIEDRLSFFTPKEFLEKVYQRTGGSVICYLNRDRIILREGDWFLKLKNHWRNVHSLEELKSYLTYSLKGELFIFDKIEKRENGLYFIGTLFNEKRTVAKRVETLINREKLIKRTRSYE